MKLLGIDYGRRKIGLALSQGILAEPWKVIRVNDFEDAVEKVLELLKTLQADKIVVGISEGEMGEESKRFSERLGAETFDETLSTYMAQELSKKGNIPREKRKSLEDAYAAAIMLQNYLGSK